MATTPKLGIRYPVGTDPVALATYFYNLSIDVDNTVPRIQSGTFSAVFTAAIAVTGTLTFPAAFANAPVVVFGVTVGGNLDININMTALPSASSVAWRAFQNLGSTVSGSATVHWVAFG